MNRILFAFAMLLPFAAHGQDSGISYASESASEMYLACGNDYVAALDPEGKAEYGRSIGYQVNPETAVVGDNSLTYQVVAAGPTPLPKFKVPLQNKVSGLTETAKKGQLFIVYFPVKGKPDEAVITFHMPVNGMCKKVLGPYKMKGAEHFPPLVQDMIREKWNQ